jgi:predicted heme/steroid binding protein
MTSVQSKSAKKDEDKMMKNSSQPTSKRSNQFNKGLALIAALSLSASLMACAAPAKAATTLAAATTAAAVTTTAAGESTAATTAATTAAEKSFTVAELAKYDGQNGNPAYIAVDGIVYDVSAIGAWRDGIHQGKYKAGLDYTDLIKQSPHGTKVLDQAVKVGVLTA